MTTKPDLTQFLELSPARRCAVGTALAALEESERRQLEAALADASGAITSGAIQKWLRLRELPASVSAVTAHRHETCRCVH